MEKMESEVARRAKIAKIKVNEMTIGKQSFSNNTAIFKDKEIRVIVGDYEQCAITLRVKQSEIMGSTAHFAPNISFVCMNLTISSFKYLHQKLKLCLPASDTWVNYRRIVLVFGALSMPIRNIVIKSIYSKISHISYGDDLLNAFIDRNYITFDEKRQPSKTTKRKMDAASLEGKPRTSQRLKRKRQAAYYKENNLTIDFQLRSGKMLKYKTESECFEEIQTSDVKLRSSKRMKRRRENDGEPIERNDSVGTEELIERNDSVGNEEPIEQNDAVGTEEPIERNDSVGNEEPIEQNDAVGTEEPIERNESVGTEEPIERNDSVGNDEPEPTETVYMHSVIDELPKSEFTGSNELEAIAYEHSFIDELPNIEFIGSNELEASAYELNFLYELPNIEFTCSNELKASDDEHSVIVELPKSEFTGSHELEAIAYDFIDELPNIEFIGSNELEAIAYDFIDELPNIEFIGSNELEAIAYEHSFIDKLPNIEFIGSNELEASAYELNFLYELPNIEFTGSNELEAIAYEHSFIDKFLNSEFTGSNELEAIAYELTFLDEFNRIVLMGYKAIELNEIIDDDPDTNTRHSRILNYPEGRPGAITVNLIDYLCLGTAQYINDIIIDFYLTYFYDSVLTVDQKRRTHIFSTHFFTIFELNRYDITEAATAKYKRIKSWTKKVNIFEKDFIIVPIIKRNHWFLAIICFPALIASQQPIIDDDQNIVKHPCILIFDSLVSMTKLVNERKVIASQLHEYLTFEYAAKIAPATNTKPVFNDFTMSSQYVKVPQQKNGTDCGLYLLQFVEQFFLKPITNFKLPKINLENWFEPLIIARKREDISILIKSLMYNKNSSTRDVLLPQIALPTKNGQLVESKFNDGEPF